MVARAGRPIWRARDTRSTSWTRPGVAARASTRRRSTRRRPSPASAALPGSVLMVTAELAWPLFRFGPSDGTAFPDTPVSRPKRSPSFAVARRALRGGHARRRRDGHGSAGTRSAAGRDRAGDRRRALAGRPLCRCAGRAASSRWSRPSSTSKARSPSCPRTPRSRPTAASRCWNCSAITWTLPSLPVAPRYEGTQGSASSGSTSSKEGKATLVRLPDVGMKGNSHMMMGMIFLVRVSSLQRYRRLPAAAAPACRLTSR